VRRPRKENAQLSKRQNGQVLPVPDIQELHDQISRLESKLNEEIQMRQDAETALQQVR
jgi:hypothetical protein